MGLQGRDTTEKGGGSECLEVLAEQPGEVFLSRIFGEGEGAAQEVSGGRAGLVKGMWEALWLELGLAPR